jgi:branched-subunit amino acid aminotransferase/4-amino-4-deoxychorismate lyase
LEATRAVGIETAEERITKSELLSAPEVFLSSTTAEVTPVATVDGKQIGNGKPGPVSTRVFEQFARMFIRK